MKSYITHAGKLMMESLVLGLALLGGFLVLGLAGWGPVLCSVVSPTQRPVLRPTLGLSQASAAEDWCYTVESMQVLLAERYGEAIVFSGTAADGRAMTLFASAAGSWTLFQVDADGAACPIASGENGHLPKGPIFIQLNPEDPA